MHLRMNWRIASRLSVITLAILVVIVVALFQKLNATPAATLPAAANSSSSSNLQGTDLGKTPAPGFQLKDQNGNTVALSNFAGKPVVLTFLYTHCPDICPLTAERLHTTMTMMGSNAKNVAVLAVSTDPKGDTQNAALNFTEAHSMQNYWHYLIGTQQQLLPVWNNYSIAAQPVMTAVNHTTAIYVIDKHGLERVYMDVDFQPAQLVANLDQLLKEN